MLSPNNNYTKAIKCVEEFNVQRYDLVWLTEPPTNTYKVIYSSL